MELWIRSQDKTIFQKVDNLLISDGDNAEGTFNIYTNSLPAQNVLGRYKTKERALEVLDEIQNKLTLDCNINGNYQEMDLQIKARLVESQYEAIYEMPKE